MIYTPSRIPGAWIMDVEPIHDQRGFFAMTWLPEELRERGMDPALAQCNLAFNHKRGTLRGMHFQKAPHVEWLGQVLGGAGFAQPVYLFGRSIGAEHHYRDGAGAGVRL